MSTVDRQGALYGAKLRALVADRWGVAERQTSSFGPGAALVASTDETVEGWIYVADPAARGLGAALVWADRHGVVRLQVLADRAADGLAGLLSRQAAYIAEPNVTVWAADGRELLRAKPAPFPARPGPAALAAPPELVDALIDAGLEVVVEAGIVRGEINGLEVARIVQGESTAGVPLDEPLLEVGVGAADRELTTMLHGSLSPLDQLGRAVEIVRQHRVPGAPFHPLNQLVPERWLRAVLCRSPEVVGLATLRPADGPRPRANLSERNIAFAVGEMAPPTSGAEWPARAGEGRYTHHTNAGTAGGDAGAVVVACSVGVDVELVPAAADARAALDPTAALWLVSPERDDHPTTRRLASRLRTPIRVVPVGEDWRALP